MAWDQNDPFKNILKGDIEQIERQAEARRREYFGQLISPYRDPQSRQTDSSEQERQTAEPKVDPHESPTEAQEREPIGNGDGDSNPTGIIGRAENKAGNPAPAGDGKEKAMVQSPIFGGLPDSSTLSGSRFANLQSHVFEAARPTDALEECFAAVLTASLYALDLLNSEPSGASENVAPTDERLSGAQTVLTAMRTVAVDWLSQGDGSRVQLLENRLAEIQANLTSDGNPKAMAKASSAKRRRRNGPAKKAKSPHGPE